MPWISKAELRRLIRQLERAEQRAGEAESALQLERRENRQAERHFANMLLRKANTYPLAEPRPSPAERPPVQPFPIYDRGELEALEQEGARLGLTREQVREFFAREKNLQISDLPM